MSNIKEGTMRPVRTPTTAEIEDAYAGTTEPWQVIEARREAFWRWLNGQRWTSER